MNKNNVIMCRCEDITLKQIDDAIEDGFESFEALKRILRVGMGSCQAQNCGHLVQTEISKKCKLPIENVKIHKSRPMLSGIQLKAIVKDSKE